MKIIRTFTATTVDFICLLELFYIKSDLLSYGHPSDLSHLDIKLSICLSAWLIAIL